MKELSEVAKAQAKIANLPYLESADWTRIRKEALYYAMNLERRFNVQVKVAEDVVQQALLAVCSQTRFWDRRRVPELRHFVFGAVRSEFSNSARKSLRERDAIFSYFSEFATIVRHRDSKVQSGMTKPLSDPSLNPTLAMERTQILREVITQLKSKDADIFEYYENCERYGLFDGVPQKDVADKMGITPSTFSKRKSKLVKAVEEIMETINENDETVEKKGAKK